MVRMKPSMMGFETPSRWRTRQGPGYTSAQLAHIQLSFIAMSISTFISFSIPTKANRIRFHLPPLLPLQLPLFPIPLGSRFKLTQRSPHLRRRRRLLQHRHAFPRRQGWFHILQEIYRQALALVHVRNIGCEALSCIFVGEEANVGKFVAKDCSQSMRIPGRRIV